LNIFRPMTTSSFHSEPTSRVELSIAVITIYAIAVAILACQVVTYVRATETKNTPPATRLITHNV
jgi:hypothetical protein